MKHTVFFFRRLFRIIHLFWIAVCVDALYILRCVLTVFAAPGEAMSAGICLSAVHGMTEHVLMSTALLLLGSICAQILRRSRSGL